MNNKYVFLMSVYNEIEAENVAGVLEMEGINSRMESPGRQEIINYAGDTPSSVDIYVPEQNLEDARHVIEVEMVRGDF